MTVADHTPIEKRIIIQKDGCYKVLGGIPLTRKIQIVSELGEPLTWKTEEVIKTRHAYGLCRCGQSCKKPFCDGTHLKVNFEGMETADTYPTRERQFTYSNSTRIIVRRDMSLCMDAGFCGTYFADIEKLVSQTADTQVRSLVMAMIERCPSGSLTYTIEEGDPDIEPDLPQGGCGDYGNYFGRPYSRPFVGDGQYSSRTLRWTTI